MTKEEAIAILKQPDRIGCTLIKATDEESCKYNQESIEALNMAIKALEQPTGVEDLLKEVSDQKRWLNSAGYNVYNVDMALKSIIRAIQNMPHGTCKDCKHWKDSDGVYRRGIGAESKCPINIKEVYEGNFYCKYFEKRVNKVGWSSLENVREKVERGNENETCKDCKYWYSDNGLIGSCYKRLNITRHNYDYHCADFKRRENNNDKSNIQA